MIPSSIQKTKRFQISASVMECMEPKPGPPSVTKRRRSDGQEALKGLADHNINNSPYDVKHRSFCLHILHSHS